MGIFGNMYVVVSGIAKISVKYTQSATAIPIKCSKLPKNAIFYFFSSPVRKSVRDLSILIM